MGHPKDENTGLFKCKDTTAQAQGSSPYEGSLWEGGENGRRVGSCCSHGSINCNALADSGLRRLSCSFPVPPPLSTLCL